MKMQWNDTENENEHDQLHRTKILLFKLIFSIKWMENNEWFISNFNDNSPFSSYYIPVFLCFDLKISQNYGDQSFLFVRNKINKNSTFKPVKTTPPNNRVKFFFFVKLIFFIGN